MRFSPNRSPHSTDSSFWRFRPKYVAEIRSNIIQAKTIWIKQYCLKTGGTIVKCPHATEDSSLAGTPPRQLLHFHGSNPPSLALNSSSIPSVEVDSKTIQYNIIFRFTHGTSYSNVLFVASLNSLADRRAINCQDTFFQNRCRLRPIPAHLFLIQSHAPSSSNRL